LKKLGNKKKIQPPLEFTIILAWSRSWTLFPLLWVWGTYPCSCY